MSAPNPAASMSMNELIRSARPSRTVGLIDKLRTTPPLGNDRAERLHRLVNDHENAIRRGDEVAAAVVDDQLDRLFEEARAAREPGAEAASNVGQPPEPPAPVPSFDGGVRRPVTRREPLTMGQAIRAELTSREEIRQRHQDHARAWDRAARR